MDGGAWWAAVHRVAMSQTRWSDFTFTFHFHALEKEMATHSSVLAWRIPGTAEPGRLQSMGSHRVRHNWSDLAAAAAAAKQTDGSAPWTVAQLLLLLLLLLLYIFSQTPPPPLTLTNVVPLAELILSSLQHIRTAINVTLVVPRETRHTVKCVLTLQTFQKPRFGHLYTILFLFP